MNYIAALDHPQLFQSWFTGASWKPWRTIERAIFGLPLDSAELPLFRELTGRDEAPDQPCSETWIIAGRRSAKTRKAATIATYLATLGAEVLGTRARLAPGERGLVLCLAVDKAQARLVLDYARAYFERIPVLKRMVVRETAEGLELDNQISLVVAANDFRSIRGRTIIACLMDECAYWRSDLSSNPDVEVYRSIRPALAAMPGSLLIGISSPYRQKGLLWDRFKRYFGVPGKVLVVKAPTTALNPLIDQRLIDEDLEADHEAASAEWLAEFRRDLADYVTREVVESLVAQGIYERPPVRGMAYRAFTDPSGGSNDGFTLGITHCEGEVAVLDCLRERRPPFSPEAVVEEFSGVLKSYGLRTVTGDRYAGEWPREQFRKRGVQYRPSELTKSQIYLEALPLLNGGLVNLLDDDRLVNQICGLERRVARGGKDSVDHAPHASDDLANAALGAAWLAAGKVSGSILTQKRLLGV